MVYKLGGSARIFVMSVSAEYIPPPMAEEESGTKEGKRAGRPPKSSKPKRQRSVRLELDVQGFYDYVRDRRNRDARDPSAARVSTNDVMSSALDEWAHKHEWWETYRQVRRLEGRPLLESAASIPSSSVP